MQRHTTGAAQKASLYNISGGGGSITLRLQGKIVPHDPWDVAGPQSLREDRAPPAQYSLAVLAVATALWRTSGRRFRSPIARVGSSALWKSVAVAISSTAHLDMRGRSLDRHPISVYGKNSGFGCQAAFVPYAQNSLCVLLRLLFGAKPLGLSRGGGSGQKLNSVVSHVLFSHVARSSAHYFVQLMARCLTARIGTNRCPSTPPPAWISVCPHRGRPSAQYATGSGSA